MLTVFHTIQDSLLFSSFSMSTVNQVLFAHLPKEIYLLVMRILKMSKCGAHTKT